MIKEKVLGKKWRAYTTIDGNACKEEQRIGYCWSEIHRGYLTVRLMKEHQCCERNCRHFQKYEDAQYWKQKEKRKSESIIKKHRAPKDVRCFCFAVWPFRHFLAEMPPPLIGEAFIESLRHRFAMPPPFDKGGYPPGCLVIPLPSKPSVLTPSPRGRLY